jgi:hypothetical protein
MTGTKKGLRHRSPFNCVSSLADEFSYLPFFLASAFFFGAAFLVAFFIE